MKKYSFLIFFFFNFFLSSQEIKKKKVFQSEKLNTDSIIKELKSYRSAILNSTYSKDRLFYFLPHEFYIPLIYAYEINDKGLKNIFQSFLNKELFLKVKNNNNVKILDKYIFYFFLAEFVRLDNSNIKTNKELFSLLIVELNDIWNLDEGKVWEREKLHFKGKKERIYSILKNKNNGKLSYYKAITDKELFPLAMGSSLFLSQTKFDLENGILKEIVHAFTEVFYKLVEFYDDGTWVLQPNVWKDHRDYKNVELNTNEHVVWDSSHFSRFPAFLYLLSLCYKDSKDDLNYLYIKKLKLGLTYQFVNKICYQDSIKDMYQFTNFVNGNDSPFRVGYYNNGKGYNASENYKHVFWGWWKLLNNSKIDQVYEKLNTDFYKYFNIGKGQNRKSSIYKEIINLK